VNVDNRKPFIGFQIVKGVASRYWVTLILIVAVLGSAFGVVFMSFQNLSLMNEIGILKKQRDALDIERRNLRLEQSAISEHSRIEQIAREQLQMQIIDIEQEQFIVNESKTEVK
jgi:cell division protein FtsL